MLHSEIANCMIELGLSVDKRAIIVQYVWWGIINKAAETQRTLSIVSELVPQQSLRFYKLAC